MEFNITTTGINVNLEDIGVSLTHPETLDLLTEGIGYTDIIDSRDLEDALILGTLIADDGNGLSISANNIGSLMGRVDVVEPIAASAIQPGDNVSQLVNDELYIKEIDLTADSVQVTPTGNLTSTDAQAALEELQSEIDTLGTGLTLVLTWTFRNDTGAADPGNGRFRLNNSDPLLATEIYLDSQTAGGADVSTILNAFNDNSRFYLQETGESGRFIVGEVTSITDNFGWFTLAITVADSGISFQQNRDCSFIFVQAPSTVIEPEIGDLVSGEYTSGVTVSNYPTVWTDVPFESIQLENNTDVIQQDPVNDDRFLLKDTGLYLCSYSTNIDDNLLGRIRINDSVIPTQSYGSYGSTIDADDIAGLLTQTFTFEATAGDFITLQQRAESTFENTISKNGVTSTFTIVRLAGAKGDKGDKGDTGSPGSVDSVVAGTGISVNNSDPANPIVSSTVTQVSDEFYETTKAGTQNLPASTAFQNITGFDTPPAALNTISGITFNTTTGQISCTTIGVYRIEFNTTLSQYNGNNRTTAEVRLTLNGTQVKGTLQRGYHRQNAHGSDTYSFSKTLELIPGNTLQVQARNIASTIQQQILEDSTIIRITKIKN